MSVLCRKVFKSTKILKFARIILFVFISAVPERGDAEGAGDGGPGGRGFQETGGGDKQGGGGKEVSHTKFYFGEMLRKIISYPCFYSSRKCHQLENKKGSFFFDDKWPGSVANFLLLPEARFVAMCGNVWQCEANCVFVCGLRG